MVRSGRLVVAAVAFLAMVPRSEAWETPPPWAFVVNLPGAAAVPDDGRLREVPGSSARFTLTQVRDLYNVPDWHPESHPPMPGVVAHGPRDRTFACGFCHLPNGLGRPENANLAGLPEDYIVRQVADMRNGTRRCSEARHLPAALMAAVAETATESEVREAARYFASLKARPWIRVVETDSVPVAHASGWMLVADDPSKREPIAGRIVELPEDLERTELRDADSGFVAYVPVGSVARGRALSRTADRGAAPCTACHGPDLRGLGPVPALAGRSPSYLVRQLHDMKAGTRRGAWWALMEAPVTGLSDDDVVAIASYAASLSP